MIDPFGQLMVEIRADGAVQAIVAQRVTSDKSLYPLQTRVVMADFGGGFGPPGRRRVGLQDALYQATCFGPKDAKTGPVTSRQLAGAVAVAVHEKGPREDAQGRRILHSMVESIGPALEDPDTGEPFTTVLVSVIAATDVAA